MEKVLQKHAKIYKKCKIVVEIMQKQLYSIFNSRQRGNEAK